MQYAFRKSLRGGIIEAYEQKKQHMWIEDKAREGSKAEKEAKENGREEISEIWKELPWEKPR